ncbi:MAG: transglutaminase family protein [Candidatus Lambdaproteobacteria bacterium]|nr:transglutaminase family protein [Candidatus Lambdaproteobacteria bacterium]
MEEQFPAAPGEAHLAPTRFLDSDHPAVRDFAHEAIAGARGERERAVRLFYAVRDGVRYDGLDMTFTPERYTASTVLARRRAYCIPKAILLAASARVVGMPSSLGFGDVVNHIAPPRLLEAMETNVFYWHGNTNLFIEGRWVKATPAFNIEMCRKFNVLPLEFDGVHDSLLHPYDALNNRHMEYVGDHGAFADFPAQQVFDVMRAAYPRFSQLIETGGLEEYMRGPEPIPAQG